MWGEVVSTSQGCQTLVTLWIVAHQATLSVGFPRQEYWSRSPFPSAGDLPEQGIEPPSLKSLALAGRFFTAESPGKPNRERGPAACGTSSLDD